MKKLSIILALMLAMTAFTGCNKEDKEDAKNNDEVVEEKVDEKKDKKDEKDKKDTDKDKEKERGKEDQEAPEEIVETFLDDVFSQNLGDYEDYFTDDADAEDDFEVFKDVEFISKGVEVFTELLGEDMGSDLMDAFYGTLEYEIDDVKKDGYTAEVTVTLKAPDLENYEMDEEEMMIEVMGIDPSTATEDDVLEWLEENGLDENFTEKDMIEILGKGIVDYVIEAMEDADKTETEAVFSVEKNDDGKWRISNID